MPYLEIVGAKQLINTILRTLVVDYEILEEFLIDRGLVFISNFWRLLINLIGTYYKYLTAFRL